MREKIIKIIEELTDSTDINGNVDLIEEDILDSFAFIELIAKLEDEFNIEIQPTLIPGDTWRIVDKIVKMVETKMEKK